MRFLKSPYTNEIQKKQGRKGLSRGLNSCCVLISNLLSKKQKAENLTEPTFLQCFPFRLSPKTQNTLTTNNDFFPTISLYATRSTNLPILQKLNDFKSNKINQYYNYEDLNRRTLSHTQKFQLPFPGKNIHNSKILMVTFVF